jgi:hypothetical protein
MKRGELTVKFLELIEEFAGSAADHLVGFLAAGYGASLSKLEYEAQCHRRSRERLRAKQEIERVLRQRYYLMRFYLKTQGFISVSGEGGRKIISKTQRGEFKLRQLKKEALNRPAIPTYRLEPGSRVLIIAFDIPEKNRLKRAWLRSVLKNLGFKIIQQSVWVGRGNLPAIFLDDLEKMGLVEFVEIFEVTKKGTLQRAF